MQIETLKVLLAIADNGSTRKAAEALCTSFQNVSRVLKQAEDEWGVQLFTRGSKGMTPTDDGAIALLTVREMMKLYEQMLDQFQYRKEDVDNRPNEKISGSLTIVSSIMANNALLNDILLEFSMHYPRISIRTVEEDAYFVQNDADAHISLAPRLDSELVDFDDTVVPLLHDRVVLLVKRGSVYDQQHSISLKRVAELPLVILANSHWEETVIGHILQANHLVPSNACFIGSITGFQKYLDTGQYASLSTDIISRKMLSNNRHDLRIINIRNRSVEITYCMAVRDREHLTETERCFVEFVQENFHMMGQ